MAATKLTPKMTEALNAAAAAQGVTHLPGFRSATLAALIDRGLLVVTAISGFKITDAGRAALPESETESTTLREQYADTPARFNPEVIDEVHARALTENVTRVGKPEAALIELVENYQTSPYAEEIGAAARPVKLYDRTASQAMFVLGTGRYGKTVKFRYENDAVNVAREVGRDKLRDDDRYVALCDHYRTVADSCPGCDDRDGELWAKMDLYGTRVSVSTPGQGSIELGVVYQHADCTWSAATPDGEIIAVGLPDFAAYLRVLALDHKRRSLVGAYNDNVLFDARRLDEVAAAHAEQSDRAEQIADAVRLLIKLGVTTPELLVAKLAAVTEENKRVAESYRGLSDRLAATHETARHGNATIIQPRR